MADAARSMFFNDIRSWQGSYIGQSLAESAERYLNDWGIDPAQLTPLARHGHNARVFSYGDTLAVKVNCELEQHQQTSLPSNPLVLNPLKSAYVGYDQGQVPITISVYPFLDTRRTEARHVKALCYELYTRHGLLFRDNKPDNVGLTKDGLPYVIDPGSLISVASLPAGEPAFIYPQWSGFQGRGMPWEEEAMQHHGFNWPESQMEVPEIAAAAAMVSHSGAQRNRSRR